MVQLCFLHQMGGLNLVLLIEPYRIGKGKGINNELSATYSPQSNGEAESVVKRVKHAIAHSDGTASGIKTACHNLNWEQRVEKSGSPAELFLHRSPCFPGLVTIPHKLLDSSEERRRREESRNKPIEQLNKGLRDHEIFEDGETVYLQDQDGRWTLTIAKVISRRSHQGIATSSYL